MASIQKRGKTYQYTVSHMVDGKSKPIRKGGFRTKKDAKLASAEIEVKLGKGRMSHLTSVPISEYFERWVVLYKSHLSLTTQQHYKNTSKEICAYFGTKPLQEIKRHDYQLFLNEYGSNKSKESVEKLNGHIRACVKDAIEEQIIPHDFTRKAVLAWTKPSKKPFEKHLNFFESELLLNEILRRSNNELCNVLILLGLTSGMRFGEMVGLTKNDFDFINCTIKINKTWGYKKRSPEGFGATKNSYSNRTIKMNNLIMTCFKSFLDSISINSDQLVFYRPNSKYKVISNTLANSELKKICNELGVEPITIHGLRHTHVSTLIYKKVSIYYVSERIGHSDVETTLKEYAHLVKELREEDEKKTIGIFNDMIKEKCW